MIRACTPVEAETDWRCRSQLGMFHCCPPSLTGAPALAPPPRWGNDGAGLPLWLKLKLRQRRPPGRSWWQTWRRWANRDTSCVAVAGTGWVQRPSSRNRWQLHTGELEYRNIIDTIQDKRLKQFGAFVPVRMWAKAYLRVIFRAGCLGPKTSSRNAVKLHRIPKKQKAAMTLKSRTDWELMQKSVGWN